jgi:5-methylcytosine-specific restriction endonuclease McrA
MNSESASGPIDEAKLREMVDRGLLLREMATELGRTIASVRYWLARYAIERPGRRQLAEVDREAVAAARQVGRRQVRGFCPRHGESDFVLETRGRARCKMCRQEAVNRRRRNVKRILVEEAGGRCAICGYDKYVGALQFHHRDPSQKAFSLSATGVTRSLEKARAEARKCELLCANCHAEIEAGMATLP